MLTLLLLSESRCPGLCIRCSVIHSFHVHRCFKLVLCNLVCAIPLVYAKLEFARVPSLNKQTNKSCILSLIYIIFLYYFFVDLAVSKLVLSKV